MSGHSHYATVKRRKESQDAQKGKIFSKLSRAISLAVRAGGGPNIDANYKLRMAVDAAKSANMPKENIERAISRASEESANIEELTYEGFGPGNIAVVVEVASNNRNRTVQEIKNLFDRAGGNLGGPGSVSYLFEKRGLIVVDKVKSFEDQFMEIAELGVEDIEDAGKEGIEIYVQVDELRKKSDSIKKAGHNIRSSGVVLKPKNYVVVDDIDKVKKILKFLDSLEEHDDVQKVFANLDIPQNVLEKI